LSRPESESPASPGTQQEPELGMTIDISNIWFGRARTRPQKALQLSENGFTMHLTKNGIGKCFEGKSQKWEMLSAEGYPRERINL